LSESFELAGVFSVLPTAFRGDGELDLDGTSALVRATADAGVSGLTVLGVMGEAAELSEEERHQVVSCVRTTTTLPIVVGVSGGSARIVSGRAEAAARSGVSAIMVSPSGTLALADAVTAAAAGGLPIIIQDYPAGSGVPIAAAELIAVVAEQPLVVGVKAEAPPTSGSIETLRAAHPRLNGGDDRVRHARASCLRRANLPDRPGRGHARMDAAAAADAPRGLPAVQPGRTQGGLASPWSHLVVLLPPAGRSTR
jgi:dihydrodipicolinate synthase/N-acetylneuraminate lyase